MTDSIKQFWKTLFNNVKTDYDLDCFLKKVSGKSYEVWEKEYNKYNDITSLRIDKYFLETNWKDVEICGEIKNQIHWVGLYRPICAPYIQQLLLEIKKYPFIKDKKIFIKIVEEHIFGICTDISYRTILCEIDDLKNKKILEGDNAEQRYEFYSHKLLHNPHYIKAFYIKYPVLFDIMRNKVKNIINYISFILKTVSINFDKIKKQFDLEDLNINYIKFDMGDTHANGKSVCTLILNDESKRLLFKPRSAAIDLQLYKFSKELDHILNINHILMLPKILSGNNYCFVEFVENKECLTDKEISEYYLNMGKTLAILFLFHSKDYHGENILSSGPFPYLIDNETILHKVDKIYNDTVIQEIAGYIAESVYGTGVLPFTISSQKNGKSMEVGALNSGKQRVAPFTTHKLVNRKTDDIKIEDYYKTLEALPSSPKYKGEVVSCEGYLDILQKGFSQVILAILDKKKRIIKIVAKYFSNQKIRYIYRGTNIYSQLLDTSYHPELLTNAIDRKVYFLRLFEYLNLDDPNDLVMGNYELQQLLNGDVPLFYTSSDDGRIFDYYFNEILKIDNDSLLDQVLERIDSLSKLDLLRQQRIINMSFIGSGFMI